MPLLTGRLKKVIIPQEWQGTTQGLQVVAPTARGAAIDLQIRVAPHQVVPEFQVALHVKIFGDALPILRFPVRPEIVGIHVEILPVKVDALAGDEVAHPVGHPFPRLLVAQVQKPPRFLVLKGLGEVGG